jgi:hypothetical protein
MRFNVLVFNSTFHECLLPWWQMVNIHPAISYISPIFSRLLPFTRICPVHIICCSVRRVCSTLSTPDCGVQSFAHGFTPPQLTKHTYKSDPTQASPTLTRTHSLTIRHTAHENTHTLMHNTHRLRVQNWILICEGEGAKLITQSAWMASITRLLVAHKSCG